MFPCSLEYFFNLRSKRQQILYIFLEAMRQQQQPIFEFNSYRREGEFRQNEHISAQLKQQLESNCKTSFPKI